MFQLISSAFGLLNTWVSGKQKLAEAEQDNRARLLRDEQSHNSDWEMAALQDKDKWLRRISFTMFSFPMVMAWVDPERANEYFEIGLASVPEWFLQMYMGMVGGIWGLAELKRVGPGFIAAIKGK